ncbi:IclR family transcriptional regulator [Tersicoccus phoenicis]|uniref:Glycerol operon regulatory protein n=1 Tax=Tersicoccus phoenicis TaxID=554083 RepID=A0A1R1LJF0_9MICC|nr:IclR family transcriptional regulator [Tersicoccus phoenicis]OMH27654.1 IclR family transcriptional regulator [Tersicoccus phoenicis]
MTENPAPARSSGVQSVERGFELLEAIADADGEISLSGLAVASKLPLPTIHRLLRTMVALGYVRQLPSREYGLGARLIQLGEKAGRQLGSLAAPELSALVHNLGETANMAMLDGDMIVYVAQKPSPHAMRMFTEVGRRAHTHATGVGKAILAQLPDERVERIVASAGMPTPTRYTHGTVSSLLADLQQIRQRGYSVDDGEQELGVRCFAVTVPDAPTPLAISVSGPTTRVGEDFATRAVPLLRASAARIGEELNRR